MTHFGLLCLVIVQNLARYTREGTKLNSMLASEWLQEQD